MKFLISYHHGWEYAIFITERSLTENLINIKYN